MNQQTHHGGCICGASSYQVNGTPLRITVCHCLWCQRRTGTAYGTETVFRKADVMFSGAELGSYRHVSDASGRWLDVHFCTRCGTNMGLTLELNSDIRSIPAGTFNDPQWLTQAATPIRHVYIRSKRSWGDLSDGIESHEQYYT